MRVIISRSAFLWLRENRGEFLSHLRHVWTLVPLMEGKECFFFCWIEVNIEFLMVVTVSEFCGIRFFFEMV